jgi:hypothetical protein
MAAASDLMEVYAHLLPVNCGGEYYAMVVSLEIKHSYQLARARFGHYKSKSIRRNIAEIILFKPAENTQPILLL